MALMLVPPSNSVWPSGGAPAAALAPILPRRRRDSPRSRSVQVWTRATARSAEPRHRSGRRGKRTTILIVRLGIGFGMDGRGATGADAITSNASSQPAASGASHSSRSDLSQEDLPQERVSEGPACLPPVDGSRDSGRQHMGFFRIGYALAVGIALQLLHDARANLLSHRRLCGGDEWWQAALRTNGPR